MSTLSLNGKWKIRWSTGQRGGTPYVIKHLDDHDHMNEARGLPRELPGSYDGRGWLDAEVPGDVHLDLMRQGLLDDPYAGIHVFQARWVEECVWHYRRTFDAPEGAVNGRAALIFQGLDLTSIVYLNGREIARHNNAFTPCVAEVTGLLKPRGNELLVRVESGLFDVCDRQVQDTQTATGSMDFLLHKRIWMRKPQSHTEWDWSPRLLNVGINGDVLLRWDESAVIAQASVRQRLSEDLSTATVEGRLFPAFAGEGRYRLVLEADGRTQEKTLDGIPLEGAAVSLTLEQPRLWYPAGYGGQPLYPVRLSLYEGERLIHRHETAVGFRRVEVKQPVHPVKGHYFIIEINGVPVFFKGSNFVPCDMITAAITKERYDALTDLALEANFNVLRVWGGGLYEADAFYELCDRKGLMVWQEFISACGPLPVEDPGFMRELEEEAVYNLRRLSSHPSLVVWCGNNEIPPYCEPLSRLYMDLYPRLVRREDPEKYYQPASPYTSNELENAPKNDANWDWAGDQHPWSVGMLEKDHRLYRRMECRFPNEGGILGPVSLPTMLECTGGRETGYIDSMAWEVHDNMEQFWKEGTSPDEDTAFWLGLRPGDMPLADYVFAGGIVQGEGLAEYIDNFRRRAFDSASAIFWMFNDCWPASRSWTIVDYRLNRTPSFYHVKRAFSPLRVVPVRQENGEVALYGVNGTLEPFQGRLRFGVFTCAGDYPADETLPVTLPANASARIAAIPAEKAAESDIPFAILYDPAGREVSRNRLLDLRYFEYALEEPEIRIARDGDGYKLESDRFVMGVCLDLEGGRPLEDNMFDLYPGIPCRLRAAALPVVQETVNGLLRRYRAAVKPSISPPCR